MKHAYSIGIDIGGTSAKMGIVDQSGKILERYQILTYIHKRHTDFIEEVHDVLSPIIKTYGKENFVGIGVGAPNANYYKGTIEHPVNLNWKGITPFAADLEAAMQLPVKITNDANAAAVGEMKFGVAKHFKHFIMITLGTGVGSGIVIDGKLLLGKDGFAGELGHTIVVNEGRFHPGSGLKGTLEAYCSAPGVVQTAIEKLRENKHNSLLSKYPEQEITAKLITESALQGDIQSIEILAETGTILGTALANFAHFSSPEAFVLFGGLSGAGDLIIGPARNAMEAHLLEVYKGKISIVTSGLPESDAAILGAAALVDG